MPSSVFLRAVARAVMRHRPTILNQLRTSSNGVSHLQNSRSYCASGFNLKPSQRYEKPVNSSSSSRDSTVTLPNANTTTEPPTTAPLTNSNGATSGKPTSSTSSSSSPAAGSAIDSSTTSAQAGKGASIRPPAPELGPGTSGATTSGTVSSVAEAVTPKIPDVPSSSLGLFEEADAKDPNKWKKFAWKYVGALLLFMVSYKTLHWYVDRVEADGKRRREELEENKKLGQEIREKASEFSPAQPSNSAMPGIAPVASLANLDTGNLSTAQGTNEQSSLSSSSQSQQQNPQTPLELYEQVASQIPAASSEVDELYAYQRELQQKRVQLSVDSNSEAVRAEISDIDSELLALDEEIKFLESKKQKRS